MSKSVRMVVGVVAAVVVPFAAPALAAALMSSTALPALAGAATALGTTGTSAVIGAGLGAAGSAVSGGDIGKGALFGALGGGLGGYAAGAKAAGAADAASTTAGTSSSLSAAPSAGLTTTQTAGLTSMPSSIAPTGAQASQLGSVGGALPEASGVAGLAANPGYVATAPQANPGFVANMKDSFNTAWSPANRAETAMNAAKYVSGSLAAGSGMSDAQAQAMRLQQQELRRAQRANDAIFNTRRDEALKLVREADYYDPNYMGLQRARDAQLRSSRAKYAGLRGLTGGARDAEARRFDLGTGRATGTAYDQGYQTGVQARNQTRVAGLSQLPQSYQTTTGDFSSLNSAYDSAEERRRQTATDIGTLFGDLSGEEKAKRTGA